MEKWRIESEAGKVLEQLRPYREKLEAGEKPFVVKNIIEKYIDNNSVNAVSTLLRICRYESTSFIATLNEIINRELEKRANPSLRHYSEAEWERKAAEETIKKFEFNTNHDIEDRLNNILYPKKVSLGYESFFQV